MNELVRSLSMLGVAIAALVVAIVVLSPLVRPDIDPPASGEPVPVPGDDSGLGGTLTVTGDREGTLRLFRQAPGGETLFGLEGGDGRIMFATGSVLSVTQVSYDGWSFFPDEGQCALTPGEVDVDARLGVADLRCDELDDIRGNGTISLAGEIRLPSDLLVDRTLPQSGGTLTVGDETWEIPESQLLPQRARFGGEGPHDLVLLDRVSAMDESVRTSALNLDYDVEAERLTAATIERRGEEAEIPAGACEVEREVLGEHDRRTLVVEVTITCDAVDVPGLGTVSIIGAVVVDELLPPE